MVNVAPDRIIISFGVDTRDFDLAIAKQQKDQSTALSAAFEWVRSVCANPLSNYQQWRATMEFIGEVAEQKDAAKILDLSTIAKKTASL